MLFTETDTLPRIWLISGDYSWCPASFRQPGTLEKVDPPTRLPTTPTRRHADTLTRQPVSPTVYLFVLQPGALQ